MYKKILIATDGSTVSNLTACAGVAFAEQMHADILAVYVAPEYQYPVYIEIIPPSYPSEEEYRIAMRKAGADHWQPILDAAAKRGLPFVDAAGRLAVNAAIAAARRDAAPAAPPGSGG